MLILMNDDGCYDDDECDTDGDDDDDIDNHGDFISCQQLCQSLTVGLIIFSNCISM